MSVNANCIIVWDDIAIGTFDPANCPAGTHGDYDSWSATGTLSRWTIAANPIGYTFPNPIIVGGNTYTGSTSKTLLNDVDAGGSDQYIGFVLPGGAESPTVGSVAVAHFIRFDTSNNTGSDINLDQMILYPPSGGGYSVSQLQMAPSDGAIRLAGHTSPDAETISKNKVYFVVHHRDLVAETATVTVYDPDDNYSVASVSVQNGTPLVQGNVYLMQLPSGYIGDPPGSITWGDIVFIYSPTPQQLIELVTPSVISATTINFATLNVG